MNEIINEFIGILNNIHGFFMDSQTAFFLFRNNFNKFETLTFDMLKANYPHLATKEYLDITKVAYGTESPNIKGSKPIQISTRKEVRERNKPNGMNNTLIGNMALVFIYQLWEDFYREKIAYAMGMKNKNDFKLEVFGDLRYIRQSIVHNNGIAIRDVEKCEKLQWFKKGEIISITFEKMNEIIKHIKDCLLKLME